MTTSGRSMPSYDSGGASRPLTAGASPAAGQGEVRTHREEQGLAHLVRPDAVTAAAEAVDDDLGGQRAVEAADLERARPIRDHLGQVLAGRPVEHERRADLKKRCIIVKGYTNHVEEIFMTNTYHSRMKVQLETKINIPNNYRKIHK